MTVNYRKLFFLLSFFVCAVLQACDNNDPEPARPGAEGFYIVNEGGFGNGNTSISFYDEATGKVTNDLFAAVNGRPLGDQTQSMTVFNNKGYIVVQGSSKIEVIDVDDFSSVGTITQGLDNPRYLLGITGEKAYVSDWGPDGMTGSVKVINLKSRSVIKTIETGNGPNRMLLMGSKVYVANSGGYGWDNTIDVIDTDADAVVSSIEVGDNPNSLVSDADGNIWVASSGLMAYTPDWSIDEENSRPPSISKITGGSSEAMRLNASTISFSTMSNLNISPDGRTLYYIFDSNLYAMTTSAVTLPENAFKAKDYYGIAVNPFSGDIVGCVSPNFGSAGSIEIMDETGAVKSTHTVGIGPSGCAFK